MNKFITYKGYRGSIQFSDVDKVYFGHVLGIRDTVSFEGKTLDLLREGFHYMLEEWLKDHASQNAIPPVPTYNHKRPTSIRPRLQS